MFNYLKYIFLTVCTSIGIFLLTLISSINSYAANLPYTRLETPLTYSCDYVKGDWRIVGEYVSYYPIFCVPYNDGYRVCAFNNNNSSSFGLVPSTSNGVNGLGTASITNYLNSSYHSKETSNLPYYVLYDKSGYMSYVPTGMMLFSNIDYGISYFTTGSTDGWLNRPITETTDNSLESPEFFIKENSQNARGTICFKPKEDASIYVEFQPIYPTKLDFTQAHWYSPIKFGRLLDSDYDTWINADKSIYLAPSSADYVELDFTDTFNFYVQQLHWEDVTFLFNGKDATAKNKSDCITIINRDYVPVYPVCNSMVLGWNISAKYVYGEFDRVYSSSTQLVSYPFSATWKSSFNNSEHQTAINPNTQTVIPSYDPYYGGNITSAPSYESYVDDASFSAFFGYINSIPQLMSTLFGFLPSYVIGLIGLFIACLCFIGIKRLIFS